MASENPPDIPRKPIDRLMEPLTRFIHVEAAGGIVLGTATVVALILANSQFSDAYIGFWKTKIGFTLGNVEMHHSLKHWVSDGLMVIFFFVVGLEIKREMVNGELKDLRRAFLPIMAAVGGMIAPAGIYLSLQTGQPGEHGWGIPMATDIAFVVGCMAVMGPRVPRILRVMILSLAIVDDIGAILVIAIGYTDHLNFTALFLAASCLIGMGILGRLGVQSFLVYTAVGFFVWIGFHESGVHATIAGVILGLMTPSKSSINKGLFSELLGRVTQVVQGEWDTLSHRGVRLRQFQKQAKAIIPPMEYLEDNLHPWSSFVIMPVFALANAGVALSPSSFANPIAAAVMAGLVIGKPVGILFFSWLAVKMFLKTLPEGLSWSAILGGGCLGGIGFTMALFIAGLALEGGHLDAAKIGIIGGSVIASILGVIVLLISLPKPPSGEV